MSTHRGYQRDYSREKHIAERLRHFEKLCEIHVPKSDLDARLWQLLKSPGYARIASSRAGANELWEVVAETALKACFLGQISEARKNILIAEATKFVHPKKEKPKKGPGNVRTESHRTSRQPPPSSKQPPPRTTHGWGWDKDATERVRGKEWVPPHFDPEAYRREQEEAARKEREAQERRRYEEENRQREAQKQREWEKAQEQRREREEREKREREKRERERERHRKTSSSVPPYLQALDKRRKHAFRTVAALFRLTASSNPGEAENARERLHQLCATYHFTIEQVEAVVNESQYNKELWNWLNKKG